jgi:hypothetical protein
MSTPNHQIGIGNREVEYAQAIAYIHHMYHSVGRNLDIGQVGLSVGHRELRLGLKRSRVEPASVMSEQQLERKLKLPHGIARRKSRDFTECRSTEVIERRPIKHRVIREIECFGPELQVIALGECERFEQREIDHILIRSKREIPGSIP